VTDPADGRVPETQGPTWEDVARDYGRFLYSVAYRLTGNHHDTQDLVQEVLVRVHRGLTTYQPGSMEAWLSRITTNAFLDDVRKKKRRPLEVVPDLPEQLPGSLRDVDEALAAAKLPDELQAMLAGLQPEYRAAVVLCDVLGYDYAEIAEILDIPPGTVRSRIHRGRGLLRRKLA
jgi:RNA polymerase sigma-70 factor, ECF subfamily